MAANREATSGFGTIAGILLSTVPDTSMKVVPEAWLSMSCLFSLRK